LPHPRLPGILTITTHASDHATDLLRSLSTRSQVIFTGRASAGLWAALRAFGLRHRRVLIPANTCYIVAWAVLQSGNRPYLVDVDSATGNLSLDTLNRIPLDEVGALIACHMYGLGAPMRDIRRWADDHHLPLIEDAALALGAQVDGRPAGAWGDVALFSFGPGKIADVGNGGALVTDDRALAQAIEAELASLPAWTPALDALQDQWLQIYWALHQFEAINPRLPALYPSLYEAFSAITAYRLPDYPYADLATALEALPANLAHRAEMASLYRQSLSSLPGLRALDEPPGSIYWRYPLRVESGQRDSLLQHLWAEGFHEVTRWYPSLRYMLSTLTPEPCFDQTPGADTLGDEIVNLPVDAEVDAGAAMRLSAAIRGYFEDSP
jgi:dTDP-4-amino-4,6-dideoxygalactose transaminase